MVKDKDYENKIIPSDWQVFFLKMLVQVILFILGCLEFIVRSRFIIHKLDLMPKILSLV